MFCFENIHISVSLIWTFTSEKKKQKDHTHMTSFFLQMAGINIQAQWPSTWTFGVETQPLPPPDRITHPQTSK